MKILIPMLSILLVLIMACSESGDDNANDKPTSIVELLPGDGEISGWSRDGDFIEATNYSSLYDVIDGGAEKFIDNGFSSAIFQDYKDENGLVIETQIYQLSSEENARKIYEELTPPSAIPWDAAGDNGRINDSALAAYSIEFREGDLFVQVVIHEKTEKSLEIVKLFAAHILEKARKM